MTNACQFWEPGLDKLSFGICYIRFFFAQESQYFSRMVAPSTANIISWVAVLLQLIQNFVFPSTLTNGLIDKNFLYDECKDLVPGSTFFSLITLYIYISCLLSMLRRISVRDYSNSYYKLKYRGFTYFYGVITNSYGKSLCHFPNEKKN